MELEKKIEEIIVLVKKHYSFKPKQLKKFFDNQNSHVNKSIKKILTEKAFFKEEKITNWDFLIREYGFLEKIGSFAFEFNLEDKLEKILNSFKVNILSRANNSFYIEDETEEIINKLNIDLKSWKHNVSLNLSPSVDKHKSIFFKVNTQDSSFNVLNTPFLINLIIVYNISCDFKIKGYFDYKIIFDKIISPFIKNGGVFKEDSNRKRIIEFLIENDVEKTLKLPENWKNESFSFMEWIQSLIVGGDVEKLFPWVKLEINLSFIDIAKEILEGLLIEENKN